MEIRTAKPGQPVEVELDEHLGACLEVLTLRQSALQPISVRGGGKEWDAPFDLRVAAPQATDLRRLWTAKSATFPAELDAILGSNRPILLTHTVTPFPHDGAPPARVWQLSYEFVPSIDTTRTWAVVPGNEVVRVGKIGQSIGFGINAQGKVSTREDLDGTGFGVRLSTRQEFVLEASLELSLRKIVGAAVGTGGAVWKMYRQDERLDQAQTLLQVLLVPEDVTSIDCTLKVSATQAGWLGTRWGARYWPYDDQKYHVPLT